ncbi:neurexin-1 isoform X1 [Chrysoperla carnea]|uniref:neurexin-1 isoform X1 n=1 Tax=Chrysoperla carnea TaxID=189513 RepID=UPI001D08ED8E|nr:neurexin-1 isoform X1 [Chrysoperla carnea]
MPALYNNKLTLLALPSVIFEPRFVGSVRNLVYADQEYGVPRRQEMRHKEGRGSTTVEGHQSTVSMRVNGGPDACEAHDPCLHGGICISTDSGPICECRNVEYEGTFCEKDKAPSEAAFRGTEFLSYDLSQTGGEPIVSAQDTVSFYFKTRQPNGLLFYTGDGSDYLNLAIKDGGVSLTMGLSNGKQEMQIKPNRVRFDDNQWHKVTVHRKIQEISPITSFCRLSAVVDGVYADHSHIAGKFTMLSSSRVYVGGSINTRALPGSRINKNFIGCLRKVEFVADTLRLNLIDLGKAGSKLITIAGKLDFKCQEVELGDPITFTTRDAHLVLPAWNAKKSGTVSFKFRTNEPNGLIIYNSGIRPPRSDLFAVELLNGHIYIHLDLGSGGVKVRGSRRRVDDGEWHEFSLRRTGREGRIIVDNVPAEFMTPGDSNQLELDGSMYVGGTGSPFTSFPIPPALWTGVLKQGFVGCLRDLNINGKPTDLASYAKQQDSGSVRTSCHVHGSQCTSRPCHNGGVCSEGWNRHICDCTATNFTGPTCGKEAATLHFNGSSYFVVRLPNETRTQTEEVVLRFRTARPLAFLMTTSSEVSGDRVELSVAASRIRLAVRLGGRDKTVLIGRNVNDNKWHTIRYSRRASNIKLQLDGESPVRAETILGKQSTLQFRQIYLGGFVNEEEEKRMTTPMPNLIGALQQFWFNGEPYIELAKAAGRDQTVVAGAPHIKYSAKFIRAQQEVLHRPFTFKSKHTFIGLPMIKAYTTINLDFMFRTNEANGLIMFNGGKRNDFLAVELVDGHIHYAFNFEEGLIRTQDNSPKPLNDNRWHSVNIRRPSSKQHTLLVDDILTVTESPGINEHIDLDGILYLGGVHKEMYPILSKDMIESKHGFEGCLAGLDLNGESPNILEDAVVHSSLVSPGCEAGQPQRCSHNVCANRGICIQHEHGYSCDCDLTSYTGPTCSDESVAYEFGPNKGIIKYSFPTDKRPDVSEHTVALGFVTTRADAILLRILSSTSKDYLEIEIVEGNIFIVYNLGNNDHPLGEIGVKVNDNTYHVVRFKRIGANSTLQIDDYNVQGTCPTGENLLQVFNSQSMIEIGGKWNKEKKRVERPFAGVISGVVVNGMRILDYAAEQNEHISMIGDVQLVTGIQDRNDHYQKMQQTPSSSFSDVMDDLVFSGAGSGLDCNADDEDECPPPIDTGSGDDLVTPVYVPPTRSPTTTPRNHESIKVTGKPGKPGGCNDDDEDCVDGSGSGEPTEETTLGTDKTSTTAITTRITDGSSTTGIAMSTPHFGTSGGSTAYDHSDLTTTTRITDTSVIIPSGSGGMNSTHPISTHETDTTISFDVSTNATSVGGGISSTLTTEPSSTTLSTTPEPPPIIYNPPYIVTMRTPRRNNERIHSETAESVALIIGIVAAILIAIVLIIIIVIRFRPGGETRYKIDESKGGYQGPNAALLGNAGNSNGQTQYQMNGSAKNGTDRQMGVPSDRQLKKKRDSKDIKEWYV